MGKGKILLLMVAYRLYQVRLAQADATIKKQGIVGSARVVGDLDRCGACQLVCLPGNEGIERVVTVEPRFFVTGTRIDWRCRRPVPKAFFFIVLARVGGDCRAACGSALHRGLPHVLAGPSIRPRAIQGVQESGP